MSEFLWNAVEAGTSGLGALLILRTFPVVVALGLGSAYSTTRKFVGIGAYLILILSTGTAAHVASGHVLPAYGYFLLISAALYYVGLPKHHPFLLFVLCACMYFVIPGALFGDKNAILPLLGWEFMLSVYSYGMLCTKESRNLAGFLFFVFVDPTLAYSSRGSFVGTNGFEWRSVGRILSGSVLLFASGQLKHFSKAVRPELQGLQDLLRVVILSVLTIVLIYCAHAGLASLQIGMMRHLGYVVPERYVRPLAATSVRDFWARWNTYLGAWAKLHVFIPAARVVQSLHGGRSALARKLAVGAGVIVTFLLVGVIHDAYRATVSRRISAQSTLWFFANSVLLLLWHSLERRNSSARRSVSTPRLATKAKRAVLLAFAIALANLLPFQ